MAFTHDMMSAARRHLHAAEELRTGKHRGVAGCLYGIAAECAIKAMMEVSGPRVNDAFYKHFPELRTILRTALQGRRGQTLARFVEDPSFMNNWDIRMRYADARQIRDEWIDKWAEQARRIVSAMGT
jgi:hypothetical protein